MKTLAKRTLRPLLTLSKLQATESRTGKDTQIERGGRLPSPFLLSDLTALLYAMAHHEKGSKGGSSLTSVISFVHSHPLYTYFS